MVVQRFSDRAHSAGSRAIHSGDGRGLSHAKDLIRSTTLKMKVPTVDGTVQHRAMSHNLT